MGSLAGRHENLFDGLLSSVSEVFPGLVEIARILEIHPKLWRGLENPAQQDGSLCRDVPLAVDERIHALYRHFHPARKLHLTQPHRPQELFEQNLSWMARLAMLRNHPSTSCLMVVLNLNLISVSILPAEHDPELIVNSNTVFHGQIPMQGF